MIQKRSQQDIAYVIGTDKVTVNRKMNRLTLGDDYLSAGQRWETELLHVESGRVISETRETKRNLVDDLHYQKINNTYKSLGNPL